jgi:hypothetical protein
MLNLLPLALFALQAAPPAQTNQFMEVTPQGAFVRDGQGQIGSQSLGSKHSVVTASRWQNLDGGAAWIGYGTDIGDNGGVVMASRGLNAEGVSVATSFSPDELFFDDMNGAETPQVAIADRSHYAVSMEVQDIDPSSVYEFEATVALYDTMGSGTPSWTYTYPTTQNYYGGGVAIAADAKVVLAWKADPNTGNLLIEAFDLGGNPISSGTLNDGSNFHARQARMSDDGRRAYFFIGTSAYIYDVFAATQIHSHYIGASFDSHAFSGDGNTFAYGTFGSLSVYRETGGSWNHLHTESTGSGFVSRLDLDADGNRLAYINQQYSPAYDRVDVGMIDLDSNTLMWTDTLSAPGTSDQLSASGIEIDNDGERMVGCTWGDSLNATPEAFAYDDAGNMTASIDLPGSAFGVAIGPDGEVGAAGCKGVHANTWGNGGAITCFDTFDQNFHLDGVTRLGDTVSLMYLVVPNSATMGFSMGLAPSPTPLGVFDIDLSALLATQTFWVPPGSGVVPLVVPNNPGLAGQEVHIQGYQTYGPGNHVMTVKASTRIYL